MWPGLVGWLCNACLSAGRGGAGLTIPIIVQANFFVPSIDPIHLERTWARWLCVGCMPSRSILLQLIWQVGLVCLGLFAIQIEPPETGTEQQECSVGHWQRRSWIDRFTLKESSFLTVATAHNNSTTCVYRQLIKQPPSWFWWLRVCWQECVQSVTRALDRLSLINGNVCSNHARIRPANGMTTPNFRSTPRAKVNCSGFLWVAGLVIGKWIFRFVVGLGIWTTISVRDLSANHSDSTRQPNSINQSISFDLLSLVWFHENLGTDSFSSWLSTDQVTWLVACKSWCLLVIINSIVRVHNVQHFAILLNYTTKQTNKPANERTNGEQACFQPIPMVTELDRKGRNNHCHRQLSSMFKLVGWFVCLFP